MPDYHCIPSPRERCYDNVGVINGMKHLPATFTPGFVSGPSLDETIAKWQRVIDEERLTEPVTRSSPVDELAG
jgi:hypothetical protein